MTEGFFVSNPDGQSPLHMNSGPNMQTLCADCMSSSHWKVLNQLNDMFGMHPPIYVVYSMNHDGVLAEECLVVRRGRYIVKILCPINKLWRRWKWPVSFRYEQRFQSL